MGKSLKGGITMEERNLFPGNEIPEDDELNVSGDSGELINMPDPEDLQELSEAPPEDVEDEAVATARAVADQDYRSAELILVEKQTPFVVAHARQIKVTNEQEMAQAVEFLGNVKRMMKKVNDEREKIIPPLYKAWKNVCALFARALDPLNQAESIAKRKVSDYLTEQERKRREQEEKARAAALEKERRQREKMEQKAEELEAAGKVEKAEALKNQAAVYTVETPIIEAPENVTEINGTRATGRMDYAIEVIDPKAFIKAVASGAVPLIKAIIIKVGPIKSYVKLQDTPEDPVVIPGVRIVRRKDVSVSVSN